MPYLDVYLLQWRWGWEMHGMRNSGGGRLVIGGRVSR